MPKFSDLSIQRLATCHSDLQLLFNVVIQTIDCTIIEGHRGQAAQEVAFLNGNSKLPFPYGKHNKLPSMAVDVAPFPVPAWERIADFVYFGGLVMGIAMRLKAEGKMTYDLRYGGDFNENFRISDSKLTDCVHFELKELKP